MRIGLIASEAAPFAKTGGLGDVTAALARHLAKAGHDARLVLPLYASMKREGLVLTEVGYCRGVTVPLGPLRWAKPRPVSRPADTTSRAGSVGVAGPKPAMVAGPASNVKRAARPRPWRPGYSSLGHSRAASPGPRNDRSAMPQEDTTSSPVSASTA